MNWLHYLLEANLYLSIFYVGYFLFLSKDTHYNLNRAYLLTTCILAFVIPFLQLGYLKPVETVEQIVLIIPSGNTPKVAIKASVFTLQQALFYLYIAGAAVCFCLFSFKVYKLFRLIKSKTYTLEGSYKVVYVDDDNTAFSFFNYLFIGKNTPEIDTIIRHELAHIGQKHSWDILFVEILKALNWFNPLLYLLQNSLKSVHEYIADEKAAAYNGDALAYSSFLLNNAYGLSGSSVTHSFFNYNLLKKRIIMLNQKRSGKLARLKFLIAVPLGAGMLCASTLAFSKTYGWVDVLPAKAAPSVSQARMPADTVPLAPKVVDIKIKPTPPPPVVKVVKFPPPIVKADGKKGASPKVQVVKFPPPIVKADAKTGTPQQVKVIKFPPPKVLNIKLDPVKADAKSAKALKNVEIRIDEPIASDKAVSQQKMIAQNASVAQKGTFQAIRISDTMQLVKSPIQQFYSYIGKNVRYPAEARNKDIAGRVIVSITVNNDNQISGVSLVKGASGGLGNEVVRCVKAYTDKFPNGPGTYQLPVSFALSYADGKYKQDGPLENKSAYLDEVVIVAYAK
ncbi:hypothetical protein GCM10023149_51790 [Mucilaginibacter gynuensis]|uniref:TonB C-terminal domain-containing protein n=1 Tax=Mucilaginibacter gynuensis TaxID=1302236 RepID=A0ABP8HK06_9SPHI